MKTKDPWHLLRKGKIESGLKQCLRAYKREPYSPSAIMELGVAYLWAQEYQEALEHFGHSIDQYPRYYSCFYGMAGTAMWCLDHPDEAVRQWSDGLKARYADTNGLGMQMPLLLYMASVLEAESYSKASAEALLREKTKDRRRNEWPGPIARWLLGQIDNKELMERCPGVDEVETCNHHWLADFYLGVRWQAEGKQQRFNEIMRKLVDTDRPEWSHHDFFLARMWSEQFFIARRCASEPA